MTYDQRVTAVKVIAHTADGRVFEHFQTIDGDYPYAPTTTAVAEALGDLSADLLDDMRRRHTVKG